MSCSNKDTTQDERRQKVDDALAICLLDAEMPSPDAIELATKYIDGEIDAEELHRIILDIYS